MSRAREQMPPTTKPLPIAPAIARKAGYRNFSGALPAAPTLADLLNVPLSENRKYTYTNWQHGVFDCCAERRTCTASCCFTQLCCACGPLCAWTSMAGAVELPEVERVFKNGVIAQYCMEEGRRIANSAPLGDAGGVARGVGACMQLVGSS